MGAWRVGSPPRPAMCRTAQLRLARTSGRPRGPEPSRSSSSPSTPASSWTTARTKAFVANGDDLDRAGLAVLADLIGDMGEEAAAGFVAHQDRRGETLDPDVTRTRRETLRERRADAPVLPRVRDGAPELGLQGVVERADKAGDADALARRCRERHDGFVRGVID